MEIPIPGKNSLYIETGPWSFAGYIYIFHSSELIFVFLLVMVAKGIVKKFLVVSYVLPSGTTQDWPFIYTH